MTYFMQGWPGESHETKQGWCSSICKAQAFQVPATSSGAQDSRPASSASLVKTIPECRSPCHIKTYTCNSQSLRMLCLLELTQEIHLCC